MPQERPRDYQKIIGEVIPNAKPAKDRPEDCLEPPWEVIHRIVAERDEARAEAARLKAAETRLLASESELEHEVQRALELIPEEFVRNDEWWKGVGRLAEAFQKLREERDAAVARVRGLEDAICHQEACTLIEDRIGPVFREAQDIRRRRSQARRREEKGGE